MVKVDEKSIGLSFVFPAQDIRDEYQDFILLPFILKDSAVSVGFVGKSDHTRIT